MMQGDRMIIEPGSMVRFFPEEVSSENFKITHVHLDEERVKREKLRAAFSPGQYYEVRGLKPGVYVNLCHQRGGVIMSDTPMEINTNWQFIHTSNGHCLVAGLGLGVILLIAQDREEVESITVIEKEQEIIELVATRIPLNEKVTIIRDDIYTWRPEKGVLFDTIYFDIWDDICGDNNPEMVKLHRAFARKRNTKNPKSWMTSWRLEDARRLDYEFRAYEREMSMWRSQ